MNVKIPVSGGKLVTKTNPTYDRTLAKVENKTVKLVISAMAGMMRPVSKMVYKDIASCIGTSRMMIRIFERFGIKAEILSVTAEIWNPKLIKLVDSKRKAGLQSMKEFAQWAVNNRKEYDASGAHLLTLGEYIPDAVGHYGVYLPDYNLFLDATLDQANRPHKSIELNTLILAELPEGFKEGKPLMLEMHKCRIYYHSSKNENYLKAVDWTDNDDVIKHVVDDMVKTIKETPTLFI